MKKRLKQRKFHGKVTVMLLVERAKLAAQYGYAKPRWVHFCELLLPRFRLVLQEAKTTRSKYIWVSGWAGNVFRTFKVRFSDHRPARGVQEAQDSDFYVGKQHGDKWYTTEDAVCAVERFFGVEIKRAHVEPSPDVEAMDAHLDAIAQTV